MLQNEPSREDFNFRQRRTTVTIIEVLTKEGVIQLKEMFENHSDTPKSFIKTNEYSKAQYIYIYST